MTHVPIRTCVGCGQKKERGALFRVVVLEQEGEGGGEGGEVVPDVSGASPGRGAWLCGPGCVEAAVKRKAFGRAFRGRARKVDPRRLAQALSGAGLQDGEIGLDAAPRRKDAAPEG